MDNRLEKLEELNKLNKSGHVSDEEYKTLLSEIINKNGNKNFEVVDSEEVKIQSIKEAGRNVIRIYYCIIFGIIFMQLYDFLVDVKIEYFKKVNGIVNDYESTSGSLTKSIINMEKIDDYIKHLEHLDIIYYGVQITLLYLFLYYLWHVGVSLKNVDEKIQ